MHHAKLLGRHASVAPRPESAGNVSLSDVGGAAGHGGSALGLVEACLAGVGKEAVELGLEAFESLIIIEQADE